MTQPIVLTLRLDNVSEKLLTKLRTRYFPSARNHLNAHITLFHALPASSETTVIDSLSRITSREQHFTVGIKDPFPLGKKGVGINIASFKLRKLHEELLRHLEEEKVLLTDQDQRKLRPHVTVQNKVGEEEARRTLKELKDSFVDTAGKAEGFALWRYEETGEWTHMKEFQFSA